MAAPASTAAAPRRADRVFVGVALKVVATLCFAVMAVIVKKNSARYPVGEIMAFRAAPSLPMIAAWMAAHGEFPRALRTNRPREHVLRGFFGASGMICLLSALYFLPLADATAISFAAPLMAVVFAAIFLGETVRVHRWTAVAVGFVGVMAMLWEKLGGGSNFTGAALALAAATSAASAVVMTRRLMTTESTDAIVFWFACSTTGVALAALALAQFWPAGAPLAHFFARSRWIEPTAADAGVLFFSGVISGVGQLSMTHSHRFAPAAVIAAFDYVSMIWATAFGFLFFGALPTVATLVGAAVVIGAGLYVIYREWRLGLARRAAENG
ncbi:MAG: DMT family transporter [Hyphomicrobiales bacterium]|nr:DMT family transporter [Hyphomicrobiales bacterium]MDE2016976.1 DMT family transporter [Hyphomicrobiales bacterium]